MRFLEFFKTLCAPRSTFVEVTLVRQLLQAKNGQKAAEVDALVTHLRQRMEPFHRVGFTYFAPGKAITVCDDVYGPEITLGWTPGAEMLDYCPAYYGLTAEEGTLLYNAILSCVPGYVQFQDKTMPSNPDKPRLVGGTSTMVSEEHPESTRVGTEKATAANRVEDPVAPVPHKMPAIVQAVIISCGIVYVGWLIWLLWLGTGQGWAR